MIDAITKSRELLLDGGQSCYWPAPLVRSLREHYSDRKAMEWGLRCTRSVLSKNAPKSTLLEKLTLMESWFADPPEFATFEGKVEELWARREPGSYHAAVSRLCGDIAAVVYPDLEQTPDWLWMEISILCGFDSPVVELVECCIAEYETIAASESSSMPENPYQPPKGEPDYWQTHLYVYLSLTCDVCGTQFFPDCWEGLPAGEEGAKLLAFELFKYRKSWAGCYETIQTSRDFSALGVRPLLRTRDRRAIAPCLANVTHVWKPPARPITI